MLRTTRLPAATPRSPARRPASRPASPALTAARSSPTRRAAWCAGHAGIIAADNSQNPIMTSQTKDSTLPTDYHVLKWARKQSGYSRADAAALLGMSEAELAALERGDRQPTARTFRRMIDIYQQIESVLLLPVPPVGDPIPHDYRSSGAGRVSLSHETREVIRDARRIQHFVTDLLSDDPELMPHTNIPERVLSDAPDEVADNERRRFDISMTSQKSWDLQGSFEEWRRRVQDAGVLVLLKRMPWSDCRGLSLWEPGLVPTIVVNSEDTVTARSFTLFHEYAHLLLRKSGVCLTEPSQTVRGQIERWCNAFAAAFLVPARELQQAAEVWYPDIQADDWQMKHVQRLANLFRVSRYVMARRLKELRFTNFYDWNVSELRRFDKKPERRKSKPGGVRPEVKRLSEVGTGVAFVVIEAWKGNVTDAGELADVLGLKTEQLPDFEQRAESRRSRRSA